jgi:hypothetical protein
MVAVVKRETAMAKKLIDAALGLAVSHRFEGEFPTLLESYAHYLLNCDQAALATRLLRRALKMRTDSFGQNNLRTATVLEHLAYSLYVENYSQLMFGEARTCVEASLRIREKMLPAGRYYTALSCFGAEPPFAAACVWLETCAFGVVDVGVVDGMLFQRGASGPHGGQTCKR